MAKIGVSRGQNGPPKPLSWPPIWWSLKILPPKGEKIVVGHRSTIMQTLTLIGVTVGEISDSKQKKDRHVRFNIRQNACWRLRMSHKNATMHRGCLTYDRKWNDDIPDMRYKLCWLSGRHSLYLGQDTEIQTMMVRSHTKERRLQLQQQNYECWTVHYHHSKGRQKERWTDNMHKDIQEHRIITGHWANCRENPCEEIKASLFTSVTITQCRIY